MDNALVSYSKWLVFDEKGQFRFIRTLTHTERAHFKEIYEFEIELRSQKLYAHELPQLHQPYLRGQKLIDKLYILGWDFDCDGHIVDYGNSILSKGRVRLNINRVDRAMSFALRLWLENKTDLELLDSIRVILLVLKRERTLIDKSGETRRKICERTRQYKSTHKEIVSDYKKSMAQKKAIDRKQKVKK